MARFSLLNVNLEISKAIFGIFKLISVILFLNKMRGILSIGTVALEKIIIL